jgi:hypothetical protein
MPNGWMKIPTSCSLCSVQGGNRTVSCGSLAPCAPLNLGAPAAHAPLSRSSWRTGRAARSAIAIGCLCCYCCLLLKLTNRQSAWARGRKRRVFADAFSALSEARAGMGWRTPCCQLDISSELKSAPLYRRTIAQTAQEASHPSVPKVSHPGCALAQRPSSHAAGQADASNRAHTDAQSRWPQPQTLQTLS